MEDREFIRRVDDLSERAERRGTVTRTAFLTPAEQYALEQHCGNDSLTLFGGQPGCERQAAFFLPSYLDPGDFDPSGSIRAVKITAHFGTPGHRDYLGAALGLGIARESIGDIRIDGETAYVFCLPAVQELLIGELKKAGRISLTTEACELSDVPAPVVQTRTVTFTVKSLRLDAMIGSAFGLSRTSAAEAVRMGAASLNYSVCEKTDAPVKEGDILSLRGHGKARIQAVGGRSRKDRLFVEAEIYL